VLPERRPGPALVGRAYLSGGAEHHLQELPPRPTPRGRLASYPAVEIAEVLLDLAQVTQQFTGRRDRLRIPLANRGLVQATGGTRTQGIDLFIDLGALPFQRREAHVRIGSSTGGDLPQQIADRQQPARGTEKLAAAQRAGERDRGLHRRGRRIIWNIGVSRIPPAQPLLLDPVAQVSLRVLRIHLGVGCPQRPQMVIERIDQLRAGQLADIWGQEHPVQETEDQRRVVGDEQPPCSVVTTPARQLVVLRHSIHRLTRLTISTHSLAAGDDSFTADDGSLASEAG
jgi:hypothetical protein